MKVLTDTTTLRKLFYRTNSKIGLISNDNDEHQTSWMTGDLADWVKLKELDEVWNKINLQKRRHYIESSSVECVGVVSKRPRPVPVWNGMVKAWGSHWVREVLTNNWESARLGLRLRQRRVHLVLLALQFAKSLAMLLYSKQAVWSAASDG